MQTLINKLKTALQQPLPGKEAQYLMAPFHRKMLEDDLLNEKGFKPSAVLMAICFDMNTSAFIPLIERGSYAGVHSAQISLPGGKYDEADKDLQTTALRECNEEIGLTEIEILGSLTPVKIPVSNFIVQPYIGFCSVQEPKLLLQEREVRSVLKLKLEDLLDEKIVKQGQIELDNNLIIKTSWFEVEGHKVWGATAMILSELKQLMKTIA